MCNGLYTVRQLAPLELPVVVWRMANPSASPGQADHPRQAHAVWILVSFAVRPQVPCFRSQQAVRPDNNGLARSEPFLDMVRHVAGLLASRLQASTELWQDRTNAGASVRL